MKDDLRDKEEEVTDAKTDEETRIQEKKNEETYALDKETGRQVPNTKSDEMVKPDDREKPN